MSASWHEHDHQPGASVRDKLSIIGNSIWGSSSHIWHNNEGENGMVEYCTLTQKVVGITTYPAVTMAIRYIL